MTAVAVKPPRPAAPSVVALPPSPTGARWSARARRLTDGAQILQLPAPPQRIECFDNSNLQGTNPVSSCVVFKNAKPAKRDGDQRGCEQRAERAERSEPEVRRAEEFVSESDVREAMKQKRTLVIGEKTIVTPAARELGDAHKVFVQAGWRG